MKLSNSGSSTSLLSSSPGIGSPSSPSPFTASTTISNDQQKQVTFWRKNFKIAETEVLIAYIRCGFWKPYLYRTGSMFISQNFICFHSTLITPNTLVIPVSSITALKKEDTNFNYVIKMTTTTDIYFNLPKNRDEIFELLEQIHTISINKLLIHSSTENHHEAEIAHQNLLFKIHSNWGISSPSLPSASSSSSTSDNTPPNRVTDFALKQRNDKIQQVFRVPLGETLLIPELQTTYIICPLLHSQIPRHSPISTIIQFQTFPGKLFVLQNFICFNLREYIIDFPAPHDIPTYVNLAIPFLDIKKICLHQKSIEIQTSETFKYIFTFHPPPPHSSASSSTNSSVSSSNSTNSSNYPLTMEEIEHKIRTHWLKILTRFTISSTPFQHITPAPDEILSNKEKYFNDPWTSPSLLQLLNFSPNYTTNQILREKQYSTFFQQFGYGPTLIKTRALSISLWNHSPGGIPDCFRSQMWQTCAGSIYKLYSSPQLYSSILQISLSLPVTHSTPFEEIEKDLYRTFPEHPFFQNPDFDSNFNSNLVTTLSLHSSSSQASSLNKSEPEGIKRLRNVLRVFAIQNPEIGYCQSMNFVTSVLLLYMPEPEAFALLQSITDDYIPEYYHKAMVGSIVDQGIFEFLLQKLNYKVHSFFKAKNMDLSMVTLPWFLCLFIGFVSHELSLRIMDIFLYEGREVLFKFGLALFKVLEPFILGVKKGKVESKYDKDKSKEERKGLVKPGKKRGEEQGEEEQETQNRDKGKYEVGDDEEEEEDEDEEEEEEDDGSGEEYREEDYENGCKTGEEAVMIVREELKRVEVEKVVAIVKQKYMKLPLDEMKELRFKNKIQFVKQFSQTRQRSKLRTLQSRVPLLSKDQPLFNECLNLFKSFLASDCTSDSLPYQTCIENIFPILFPYWTHSPFITSTERGSIFSLLCVYLDPGRQGVVEIEPFFKISGNS